MASNLIGDREQKIIARDATVDNAKGLLILLYVFVHIMRVLPLTEPLSDWFYHSEPVLINWWGFNLLDLAPIAFYFFIGLVLYQSFIKRAELFGKSAFRQYFIKNLSVMGIFLMILYLQNTLTKPPVPASWNYFVGIGFTGILTLPFLTSIFRRKTLIGTISKFIAAAVILVLYSVFHDKLFDLFGAASGHGGGAAASFGFVAVVLLAAGVKDLSQKGLIIYAVSTAALYLAGLLVNNVLKVPVSYDIFSAGYLFTAFTKMNLIFFFMYIINKYALKDRAIPFLAALGRNILFYMLVTLVVLLGLSFARSALPKLGFLPAVLVSLFILGLYVASAAFLEKKKILIKL
ncbi:MAG: hypothetical protein LBQ27_02895 [Clostridiales bacterium]|jgi:hypothetical protein|nr:hypothetical protein [Clostridiales bacterium]